MLIDAVGVTETKLIDSTPLERKRGVSLDKLLHQARLGQVSEDLVSSLASRLARLDARIAADDRAKARRGRRRSRSVICRTQLVEAIDPDRQIAAARVASGPSIPTPDTVAEADEAVREALLPIASNPELCDELENVQRSVEQVIDEISLDTITRADFVVDAESRAKETVESFRQFLDEHQDEITALQVYYSKPYAQRPTYADIKELADAIGKPPHRWTADKLWEAYETLDRLQGPRLGRHRAHQPRLARPVHPRPRRRTRAVPRTRRRTLRRLDAPTARSRPDLHRTTSSRGSTLIRDHLAASLSIDLAELQDPPFSQHGGLFKARELFGPDLDALLADLTEALAA